MWTPARTTEPLASSSKSNRQLFYIAGFAAAAAATSFVVWSGLSAKLMRADFLPHRYCYLNTAALVWTHVSADLLIAAAYLGISVTLSYLFYRARRDLPFHGMFLAFGLFIVACGGTHLVEVVTVWHPIYVFLAAVKIFTAVASVATAAILPFTVPRVLKLIQKAKAAEGVTAELRASEERKESLMHELQERKQMFEQFFACAPDAILVTDRQGLITDLNEQAIKMFGYSREEIIGEPVEILVPELARGTHQQHRDRYMGAPKTRPMGGGLELQAQKKDGSLVPVDITLSPLEAGSELRVMAAVRDMTEHKIAAEKLKDSLREKEVLLREVHHRVKNNLAVVCSLFYLESTYAKDERTAQVFRESESRVHSMALVHESLYGSKNLARIDFAQYAKTLATDILSSYGNKWDENSPVQLKTELEPVIMSIDLAIPCGLILNELISNAIKHGLPRTGGEIKLTLVRRPDHSCSLVVNDSGAGVPRDLDVNSNHSLGLRLVRSLTKQIGGSFELLRTEPGTSAQIEFPVGSPVN
jgi:PAS domain S-box-containing protein